MSAFQNHFHFDLHICPFLVSSPQLEPVDCSSLPPVSPLCLTLCEHQAATEGKDASSLDSTKVEKRRTTREKSCSAVTVSNHHLVMRGGPPTVAIATTNTKQRHCPPGNTLSTYRESSPPATSPVPNGPMQSVLSASVPQDKPPSPQGAITGNRNNWLYSVTVQHELSTESGGPADPHQFLSSQITNSGFFSCRCVLLSCRSLGGLCDRSYLLNSPHQAGRHRLHFTVVSVALLTHTGGGESGGRD